MAEKEEIELIIDAEGNLRYHIRGINGSTCEDVAKDVAKEFGQLKEMTRTSEYYRQETKQTSKLKTTRQQK